MLMDEGTQGPFEERECFVKRSGQGKLRVSGSKVQQCFDTKFKLAVRIVRGLRGH